MKTKLSGNVDMLHVWLHKKRQKLGIKAIKNRKRQEKRQINLTKFRGQTK